MTVSRHEVIEQRQDVAIESVVRQLVPDIDKGLIEAGEFPYKHDIAPLTNEYPELADVLIDLYGPTEWNVRRVKAELSEAGDDEHESYDYLLFALDLPELAEE